MLEVTSTQYVEGYSIRLRFNNGEERVVDLKDSLWGPMFEPLRDLSASKGFTVSDVLHTMTAHAFRTWLGMLSTDPQSGYNAPWNAGRGNVRSEVGRGGAGSGRWAQSFTA